MPRLSRTSTSHDIVTDRVQQMADTDSLQFYSFKECLARRLLARPQFTATSEQEASELDDFASYLAKEVWPVLPAPLRDASYDTRAEVPDPASLTLDAAPFPPAFSDTLVSYEISSDADGALMFLRKTIEDFVSEECAPPPPWKSTRTSQCEICEREIPLTYHHLIPRSTHAKVLKQKWHSETMINSVAWLCRLVLNFCSARQMAQRSVYQFRYCHSTVHHVATNEELARSFYTVELLLQREDIQKWRAYAARQRYGKRRG
jgi:hypothetical protein